uniref:SURF1-like protein n=1 Tax=Mesocestoides corti TaxID=53468 RepID=A0A5K3F579_MESCO
CGVGSGHRHIRPHWPQPILCHSAFQWRARKISTQPEKDTTDVQYIMSGVASVVDSDGRRLTCGPGLWLVSKACSVVPVFFLLGLGYSTLGQHVLLHPSWLAEIPLGLVFRETGKTSNFGMQKHQNRSYQTVMLDNK